MLLIKNGYMIDPKSGKEGICDILTQQGKILKIEEQLEEPSAQVIDATGLYVAPGLVDVHVHFRDPGFTHKEDIYTGAKSAAAGGVTTVVLMANTKPAVDNPETLKYVLDKGKETAIHVETCCNVTMGLGGKELAPMEELAKQGAVGFTDDGIPIMDAELLEQAMKLAAKLDMPISLHEEDPKYITNNGINSDVAKSGFGLGGSPREAEITMIKRDLEIAEKTGASVDIQHISTAEGVELVRQAKKRGVKAYAEATPHHFTLTQEAVKQFGTLAKMNPPLRLEEDRRAIIQGLMDGTIDFIATDHAPHAKEEKDKELTQAPSGIIGLETALPLALTVLAEQEKMPLVTLFEKLSLNPAKLYHLDAGYLAEGGPADMVLFDRKTTRLPEKFVSKSNNSPFKGKEVNGSVRYTICNGEIIFQANERSL